MHSDSAIAVRVGIFFTIAVIIALGLSLQVGKSRFFTNTYEVVAGFRQAGGVEPGTRVTLRGVPVGTVRSIDWDGKNFDVRVVLEINGRYQIPQNATAKIQVSSLLGGNLINIDAQPGPDSTRFLAHGDRIQTVDTPSLDEVLTTVSQLSNETESLITSLNKNQQETVGKINSVIEENRAYLQTTSESFARLGPKLETLADRMNEMTASMASGEGTIGALYSDKTLYSDLRAMADTAKEVAAQIQSGEGTLGQLIYSDETITDMKKIMTDLQNAAREVEAAIGENREGLRNLVSALADSGPKIDNAISNFNDISGKINSGEGTLGRLVNDPSLYEDAQRAVNQVGESFESAEEQGVFRSFLGLVFGALI